MLLEYQEKDLMEGEKLLLFPYPLKVPAISYLCTPLVAQLATAVM